MSATGRNLEGHERLVDDFYATPAWVTRAILPHLKDAACVLDPCCGDGAILDAVAGYTQYGRIGTLGLELDNDRALKTSMRHKVGTCDSLGPECWPMADTLITNPPYSLALAFIERWLIEETCPTAAFLLRLNFLGSQKRAAFHKKNPADVFVLPRRPGFVLALSCKPKAGGCGWGGMYPLDPVTEEAPDAPKVCPKCSHALQSSSSDATEYAWFVWGPGRGNRWFMLDV